MANESGHVEGSDVTLETAGGVVCLVGRATCRGLLVFTGEPFGSVDGMARYAAAKRGADLDGGHFTTVKPKRRIPTHEGP